MSKAPNEVTFLDVYRDFFRNYTDSPPIFCEAIGVNLLSVAVGRIPIKLTPTVYPNVWTLIVGESWLTRKTTAINALPIADELKMPCSFTPEGLEASLKEHNQGLIYKDEISGFLRSIKKKDYMKEMAELLSFLYNCPNAYSRELKKAKFDLKNVCFNILGGTQPVSLLDKEVATKEDFQTGFLARFMIVYGQRDERKPRRRWTEDDGARRKLCEDKWQQIYDYCHKTEWGSRLKFDFSDEALQRLNEFEEKKDKVVRNIRNIKKRSIEGALLRGVCDYSIKLAALYEADAQISKLATLATAPTDNSIMISIESVQKAINTMLNTESLLTANLLILLMPELSNEGLAEPDSELAKLEKFYEHNADAQGWMSLRRSLWLQYSPWRNATALDGMFTMAQQKDWFEFDNMKNPTKVRLKAILGIDSGSMKSWKAGQTGSAGSAG